MKQDSAWKEVAEDLFDEFLFSFFPHFHKDIKDVISLALLTDADPKFRPHRYHGARWGFAVTCRYPLVKIIDYRKRLKDLKNSTKPFALIVRAYLKTLEFAGNVRKKYSWKKRFLIELYQRGMKRETLLAIYKFIDSIREIATKNSKWLLLRKPVFHSKFFHKIQTAAPAAARSPRRTAKFSRRCSCRLARRAR